MEHFKSYHLFDALYRAAVTVRRVEACHISEDALLLDIASMIWTTLLMPRLIILVMLASRPAFTE